MVDYFIFKQLKLTKKNNPKLLNDKNQSSFINGAPKALFRNSKVCWLFSITMRISST